MGKKLKSKKAELRPTHVRVIKVKADNIFEIAKLLGVDDVSTSYTLDESRQPSVRFGQNAGWSVVAPIGGYITISDTGDGSSSFSGWTKEQYKQRFRDGWS